MLFRFSCPSCGYEAEACGGFGAGMAAAMRTVLCRTCHTLEDAVTHSQELGNYPPEEGADLAATAAPLRCPNGKTHEVEAWEAGGPCPRCGADMGEGEGIALFD